MATATAQSAAYAEGLTAKFADAPAYARNVFTVRAGKRYDKIFVGQAPDRMESIHAFVEREIGHVFKPAGLSAPAKHVRFTTVEAAIEAADLYGGYLYLNR